MPDVKTSRGKPSYISGRRRCLCKLPLFLCDPAASTQPLCCVCDANTTVRPLIIVPVNSPLNIISLELFGSFPAEQISTRQLIPKSMWVSINTVFRTGGLSGCCMWVNCCSEFCAVLLKEGNKQLFFVSFHQIMDKSKWRTFLCHYKPVAAMPALS